MSGKKRIIARAGVSAAPMRREGHKRQVHCVEHQLNAHKDGDDVALDQKSDYAAGEKQRAEHQIVGKRNHYASLLASTTAPMMAMSTSTEVISNGSRYGLNSSRPIAAPEP